MAGDSSRDLDTSVMIVNDDIDEVNEVFAVLLELVSAVNPDKVFLDERNASLCRIVDDDGECVCVCACARACVRVSVHVCVHACVHVSMCECFYESLSPILLPSLLSLLPSSLPLPPSPLLPPPSFPPSLPPCLQILPYLSNLVPTQYASQLSISPCKLSRNPGELQKLRSHTPSPLRLPQQEAPEGRLRPLRERITILGLGLK